MNGIATGKIGIYVKLCMIIFLKLSTTYTTTKPPPVRRYTRWLSQKVYYDVTTTCGMKRPISQFLQCTRPKSHNHQSWDMGQVHRNICEIVLYGKHHQCFKTLSKRQYCRSVDIHLGIAIVPKTTLCYPAMITYRGGIFIEYIHNDVSRLNLICNITGPCFEC